MKLRILGCSGGISAQAATTCFLLDNTTLIDAGTGLASLELSEMMVIEDIFLTHTHLDHIAMLPLLLDNLLGRRASPVRIHASQHSINMLKRHIFNWEIWPDFSVLPSTGSGLIEYHPFECGQTKNLTQGGMITALPAMHSVPAQGYLIDSGKACLAYTGDTASNAELWPLLNAASVSLRHLIIEAAFENSAAELAREAGHLCPDVLKSELLNLKQDCSVWATHLKPTDADLIKYQLDSTSSNHSIDILSAGDILEF
ncbi:3',5'-cyclic-nucleotide phosphodiesterase [Aquitalea magnusonii]|uniref:Ribonuclease BN (tRNA processing enzyme) n=1 Tax=Aquitalea magnusonii TaxID=332411 RepID=A0A318J843_9NEIS|nr:3',5'-cyclic-nucleotide phosphodiesterase [Aquitalea magnusonii]PXX42896.1 ribonuclease BN (tRNA processing enzyme) [Aquitalea magnusonii]